MRTLLPSDRVSAALLLALLMATACSSDDALPVGDSGAGSGGGPSAGTGGASPVAGSSTSMTMAGTAPSSGGGGAAGMTSGGAGTGGTNAVAGSGGNAGASPGGTGGGGSGDTWDAYAKSFMGSYCVSCHNDDNQGSASRDYHMLEAVKGEASKIACGLAKSQDDWTARGCTGFPPARQFPVGDGAKPTDEERDRLIAWIDAGTP